VARSASRATGVAYGGCSAIPPPCWSSLSERVAGQAYTRRRRGAWCCSSSSRSCWPLPSTTDRHMPRSVHGDSCGPAGRGGRAPSRCAAAGRGDDRPRIDDSAGERVGGRLSRSRGHLRQHHLRGLLECAEEDSNLHAAIPDRALTGTVVGCRVKESLGAGYAGAAGPSRITVRTWSIDSASHGNSTSHHVAPAAT
jgi:hypothetical protein